MPRIGHCIVQALSLPRRRRTARAMQRRTLQERSDPVGEPLEVLGAPIADTPDRPRRLLRHDSPPGAVVMQLAVREESLEVCLFRVRLRAQLAPSPRGGQIMTGEDPDLDLLDRVLAEQRLPLLEVLRALPFQEGQRLSPAAIALSPRTRPCLRTTPRPANRPGRGKP